MVFQSRISSNTLQLRSITSKQDNLASVKTFLKNICLENKLWTFVFWIAYVFYFFANFLLFSYYIRSYFKYSICCRIVSTHLHERNARSWPLDFVIISEYSGVLEFLCNDWFPPLKMSFLFQKVISKPVLLTH